MTARDIRDVSHSAIRGLRDERRRRDTFIHDQDGQFGHVPVRERTSLGDFSHETV